MTTRLPSVNEVYDRLIQIRHVMREKQWPLYVDVTLYVNKDLTWFLVENAAIHTEYQTFMIVCKSHTDTDLLDMAQDMLADIESQMRVTA